MSARSRWSAFVEAGHDVVVLDDLSTGHRSAVPDGGRLRDGELHGRRPPSRRLLDADGDRGDPPLRGSLAGRRIDRGIQRATSARTSPAAWRSSTPRARPASDAGRVLVDRGGVWRARRDADRRRSRRSPRSTHTARRNAPSRARCLVRPGVRPAQRVAPLLQRRRRNRARSARSTTRDAPDPERPAARRRRRRR